MAYQWSSELETGHEKIDAQHKALFAAVNDFSQAISSGKGPEEVEKTLNFLIAYTVQHFHDEEELQVQYDFPDYPRHRNQHLAFQKKVQALAVRFEKEGPTNALMREIYVSVGDWLLHHIKSDDFVVAAFINNCPPA